jgi:hypothetical protein
MQAQTLIEDALLEIGALDINEPLSNDAATRALRRLNLMLRSLVGNGLGARLHAKPVSAATTVQSDYLYLCDTTSAAFNLTLPDDPAEGWIFGVADAQEKFATNNLGLIPNGNLIENTRSTLVLSTNGDNRTWFFRGDTGDWVRIQDLALTDEVYFADDVLEGLIWMLAARLAPQHNQTFPAELAAQGHAIFTRRYGRRGRSQSDPAIAHQTPAAVKRAPAV